MTRPNPGSDAAREQGCICAVMDNNHGLYPAFGGGWWITAGCPVHAPEYGGPYPPEDQR